MRKLLPALIAAAGLSLAWGAAGTESSRRSNPVAGAAGPARDRYELRTEWAGLSEPGYRANPARSFPVAGAAGPGILGSAPGSARAGLSRFERLRAGEAGYGLARPASIQQPAAAAPVPAPKKAPAAELRRHEAIVLGIIEGVTEFLPVSSTGHLIIASRVFGLDSPQPLLNAEGDPIWHRPPEGSRSGELLTLKLATDTYIVVIQFGAIAAVIFLYWRELLAMARGVCGRDPAGLRLFINVMIAFVPSAGLGFLIHDWIDEQFYSVETVIVTLLGGAMLMFYAEYWYGKQILAGTRVERTELSVLGAAWVGILQCAALLPGTSRPMMTIVGGYFAGLDPRRAAEFSYILGFVTLTAASIYKSFKGGTAMIQVFGWPHVILGGVVAAVTAGICLRLLILLLMRYGLAFFAWYRIVLAGALYWYFNR